MLKACLSSVSDSSSNTPSQGGFSSFGGILTPLSGGQDTGSYVLESSTGPSSCGRYCSKPGEKKQPAYKRRKKYPYYGRKKRSANARYY